MGLKHILTLSRKHWEVGINLPSTLSSPKGQPAFLYILCTGQPRFTVLKEFLPLLPTPLLFPSTKYSDVTMAVGSNVLIPENGRPRKELPLGQERKQHHGCLRAWAAESASVGPPAPSTGLSSLRDSVQFKHNHSDGLWCFSLLLMHSPWSSLLIGGYRVQNRFWLIPYETKLYVSLL